METVVKLQKLGYLELKAIDLMVNYGKGLIADIKTIDKIVKAELGEVIDDKLIIYDLGVTGAEALNTMVIEAEEKMSKEDLNGRYHD